MSDDINKDDRDMLAAEYALRLLNGDDLAQAEALLRDDQDFARAVEAWTVRLAEMAGDLDPVAPSAAAKRDLMQRLFPEAPSAVARSVWDRIGPWLGVTTMALIAGLAWQFYSTPTPSTGPLYTAEIASDAGDFRVVAVVDKTANEVFLTRTAGAAPQGRILQVWSHGPGEPAMSVGLWPEGTSVRLALPEKIAAVQGVLTLGVSEEPPGGSPTGSPSGRVFGTVDIPNVIANW